MYDYIRIIPMINILFLNIINLWLKISKKLNFSHDILRPLLASLSFTGYEDFAS